MESSSVGFAQHLPGLLMAAGISLLTLIVVLNLRSRLAQRRAAEEGTGYMRRHGTVSEAGSTRSTAAISDRVDSATVQAAETVRVLSAQIDTRAAALESLIRQADERIRLLEEVLDERVGASISPTGLGQGSTNGDPTPFKGVGSPAIPPDVSAGAWGSGVGGRGSGKGMKPSSNRADQRRSSLDSLMPSSPHQSGPRPPTAAPPPRPVVLDPLTANVYELADRGRSTVEIARTLDEQIGKVELILALRGEGDD